MSGSLHLLRWMASQGYCLPTGRTYVQPNVISFEHLKEIRTQRAAMAGTRLRIEEIVFFGRLETRKGLFIFCEAIERLTRERIPLPKQITFMGKPGGQFTARPGVDIVEYIEQTTARWPCKVVLLTEFQQVEALQYLSAGPRLAVMPSVIENSSMAVYEATMCRIPFIASLSGGTPELVAIDDREKVLCESHPIPLAKKIAESLSDGGIHRAAQLR